MTPSVGRTVHWHPTPDVGTEALAAVITAVGADTVHLAVLRPGSFDVLPVEAPREPGDDVGRWNWPPRV